MQLCVRNELTMAVSTVMTNWMIVFQVLSGFIVDRGTVRSGDGSVIIIRPNNLAVLEYDAQELR